jgi:hypothetical protein
LHPVPMYRVSLDFVGSAEHAEVRQDDGSAAD